MELLQYDVLPTAEADMLDAMVKRLEAVRNHNRGRQAWYDAEKTVKNLGISLPKRTFKDLSTICGWPALTVDALEERLDVAAVMTPEVEGSPAEAIWEASGLDAMYSPTHLEALIHGVAFVVAIPQGDSGGPEIVPLDPVATTGIMDPIRQRLTVAAHVQTDAQGRPTTAALFTPEATWSVQRHRGRWEISDIDEHALGRVPVHAMVNRPRLTRQWGRSELTAPILSYTRAAIRTLIRSEVASEFFSAPQRYILGVSQDAFQDDNGNPQTALQTYLGHFLTIDDDELDPDRKRPEIGSLAASSPQPFVEMIRMYSMLASGEAALPPQYFGFVTENPASADQIRAVEARLVKRAERRQKAFGAAWRGALLDAIELGGQELTTELRRTRLVWTDASTPTRAATTDSIVKQIQVGALPATAPATYRLLGHPEPIVQELVQAARSEQFRALVTGTGSARPGLVEP